MDPVINEKIERYARLVVDVIPVSMIVLYGSYAKGMERKDSDIDVAVVVDDLNGDFLETSARLFSLCRLVDSNIEPKLVVKRNNRSGFLESIMKYGRVIYQK